MAATNYTPIQLYRTTTAAAAPIAGNLTAGEIAINVNDADMALYAKNNSGVVKRLINNPAGLKYPTVDGTANQSIVTNGSGSLIFATPISAANPTGTITGTAVNGTATTFMRSDAVPALALTIAQLNTAVSDADVAISTAAQTFTGGQRGAVTALTSSAASIAINLATNNNFSHTTSENTTLAAPSNPVAGQSGVITITQGATARSLAYNTFWKFTVGVVPLLTATVGAVDTFAYFVESATRATCQLIKDVK